MAHEGALQIVWKLILRRRGVVDEVDRQRPGVDAMKGRDNIRVR
jgi:hypothetical protein